MCYLGFSRRIERVEKVCIIVQGNLFSSLTGSDARVHGGHVCAGELGDPNVAHHKMMTAQNKRIKDQHYSKV